MSKKKKFLLIIIPIIIVLIVLSFFGAKFVKRLIIKSGYDDSEINPYNQFAKDVTMIELLANPNKYDGELIRVSGVGQLQFEGDCLFLSKEDYKYYTDNRIWLQLSDHATPYQEAKTYNGKYVLVEGIFDKDDRGHLDLFMGSIKNVTRYELWEEEVTISVQYKEVLANLKNAFPFNNDDYMVLENPELSYLYRRCKNLDEINYFFKDIDSDGQDEMFIFVNSLNYITIADLYTIKDEKLVHVFDSGERYSYNVYDNGIVKLQWSGGGTLSGTDFFKYNNGNLEFIERITYDADKALEDGIINDISDATDNNCYFKSSVYNADDEREGYIHISSEEAERLIKFHTENAHNIFYSCDFYSLARFD